MEALVSVPAKRRRWWLWGVLVAGALVVAAPVAWRYRPLNRTERQLLGTWSVTTRDRPDHYKVEFGADRQYICQLNARLLPSPLPPNGRWEASHAVLSAIDVPPDNSLLAPWKAVPIWKRLLDRARALLPDGQENEGRVTMSLGFDSVDTFRTTSSDGQEETWRRVPPGHAE